MPIPQQLAFRPTALRMPAGTIAGNPIGSGVARGKDLTAAELKAIVEASGISYLPLSGGTLTGSLTGTSITLAQGSLQSGGLSFSGAGGANIYGRGQMFVFGTANTNALEVAFDYARVARESWIGWSDGSYNASSNTVRVALFSDAVGTVNQRNALNAQCHVINKSYTSVSSQEALMLDAGKQIAGNLGLYSYRGSAGGSNYPVRVGMLAANGTTFSGLTVNTNGSAVFGDVTGNSDDARVLFQYNAGTIQTRQYGQDILTIYGLSGTPYIRFGDATGTCNFGRGGTDGHNLSCMEFRAGSQTIKVNTVYTPTPTILTFDGITSSYVGLKRNGTTLGVRLADDSADADLACGAITASDTIRIRNGLNAQCNIINKSYTSDTSQEALMLDAGKQIAGNLGLYSYRGSAGGSNYPVRVGMLAADGSTFSGLEVDTNGYVNVKGAAPFLTFNTSVQRGYILHGGPLSIVNLVAGNAIKLQAAAGVQVELVNGSPAMLTCGQFISVAPSLVSLATNGQFSVEMTSNTAGNLVYRGSDGTTRRMALLFA